MKKSLFLIAIFFSLTIPAITGAATLTGIVTVDGTPTAGIVVYAYDTGAGAIANVAYESTDTTDVSGEWTITTTNTNEHIVIIVDPDEVKASVPIIMTPEE